ncbi:MAG: 1-acyl-sn-glycerol-3-phosphate acyltransferase [Planctomycetaceae bacterium]
MEPRPRDISLGLSRRIARRLVKLYYGRIEVSDPERVPQTGPVLICANHANSLIDPIVVGIACRRPVRFMAKAPMFETPIVGPLMNALGMIPAFRGSDDQSQVKRNLESLTVGAKVLAEGDAMGIFPEGKSHDLTTVEMVRSGAARMALQAVEAGAKGLKIVPVGLNYERKEDFRSAVWVRVGEPIDVDQCLAEHDGNPRKARHALTKQLDAALRQVVIHLDDPQWKAYLDDLEVLVPSAGSRAKETVFPLRQRKWLADAINHVSTEDRPRAEEAAAAIRAYRERVRAAGIEVDAPVMRSSGWRAALTLFGQGLWVVLLFLPALLGTLFHSVPFTIVRAVAARLQQPGRTTVSFYRLMVGLPVYGLWYVAAGWWLFGNFLATAWFAWTCLLTLPFLGVLSLSYWRAIPATGKSWWHQLRFLFHRDRLAELRKERDALSGRLSALADECHQVSPRPEPPPRVSRVLIARRVAGAAAVLLALGAVAWFVPRLFLERSLVETGFDLKGLPEARLRVEMESDEKSLTAIMAGLKTLERDATIIAKDFADGKRNYDVEADNDAVRQLLLRFINYRTALIRLVWKYLEYDDVASERDRLRAFLLDYTAAMVLCESSMKFVHNFTRDEDRRDKAIARLNEAEPVWGIPGGLYDTIEKNLASSANMRRLAAAGEFYEQSLGKFDEHQLGTHSRNARFHTGIQNARETIAALGDDSWGRKFGVAYKELIQLVTSAKYEAQSAVSTWIGDFKISERRDGKSMISPELVDKLRPMLKPGDILIERRNWYVSNAFLPGYWPHAAIYVGTAADLKRMGLDQNKYVKKHWPEFSRPDHEGHPLVIIEAVSEGVLFSSLEHSIGGGDSAAVFRPLLGQKQIAKAITLAFSHAKKPYDFGFDFLTEDKLVCTEVVFRSYGANQDPKEDIRFPTKVILGTTTMPAIELVNKYATELGGDKAQLKLIAFIDGNEETGETTFYPREGVDMKEEFIKTLDRSQFTFAQDVPHDPIPGMGYLGWVLLTAIGCCTAGNLFYYGRQPLPRVR